MKIVRSIAAVIAGIITGAVLATITDILLVKTGLFPPPGSGMFIWWMLVLALLYRGIYTITGGFITALISPYKPMFHAFVLGLIGVAVCIIGAIVNRDNSAVWYPITLTLITLPCALLGGWLYEKQIKRQKYK